MTNLEVHERLIEWLTDLLGVTVIKDRQGKDRPSKPYGMVDLSNWRELQEHPRDIVYSGTEIMTARPDIEMEWVFLFMIYGDGGDVLMRKLQSAVHLNQVQEPIRPALTIHEVSAANSIPELVGERWEPRTQVNIVVRGMSGEAFAIDVIEEHGFNFTGERA